MDWLDFDAEFKFSDEGETVGEIEGYGSVFNLMDRGGDIMLPGAFKKSLSEWKKKKTPIPMLWQHNSSEPIGIWEQFEEDDRGLKVKGSLAMELPKAKEARVLMKKKAVSGLSIGYRTKEADYDRLTGARKLKQVELWEISLVTFPMLPEAQISGVKNSAGFDARAAEKAFREGGLSRNDAVLATSIARKLFLRDEGTYEASQRDAANGVLQSLKRLRDAIK